MYHSAKRQAMKVGANPIFPAIWGCSSVGRAPVLQAGGRKFESFQFHHLGIEAFSNKSLFLDLL